MDTYIKIPVTANFRAVILGLIAGALGPALYAQSFDVVSVRLNQTPVRESHCDAKVDLARLSFHGCNLRTVIGWAYDLGSSRSEGGPAWVDAFDTRFDIDATSDRPLTESEMRTKLRALLADRFHLRVRQESQVRAGYALVAGKGGAKLTQVEGEPEARGRVGYSMDGKAHVLTGKKASTNELALWLRSMLNDGREVANETGLTRAYDFTLSWTPEADLPVADLQGALKSQLGLQLEEKKVAVNVLTVENAEKPAANQ